MSVWLSYQMIISNGRWIEGRVVMSVCSHCPLMSRWHTVSRPCCFQLNKWWSSRGCVSGTHNEITDCTSIYIMLLDEMRLFSGIRGFLACPYWWWCLLSVFSWRLDHSLMMFLSPWSRRANSRSGGYGFRDRDRDRDYGRYDSRPTFRNRDGERRVNYYESRAIGKYGPPTRTKYRVIVENLSTRVSWQDLKVYRFYLLYIHA